ncbi:MAG: fimbrillin family protein [Lepagella sp.]
MLKEKLSIYLRHVITVTTLLQMLCGCRGDKDGPGEDSSSGDTPIMVTAEAEIPATRSALPQGMPDRLEVYTIVRIGGERVVVMDGYEVKYIDGNWTYGINSQTMKFWSRNAEYYTFTSGAPTEAVTSIDENGITLQLENNDEYSAMACKPIKIENGTPEFGKTVNLHFTYSHCMVRVAFVNNVETPTTITGITLTPTTPITSKGKLTYSYDQSGNATTLLTDTETSSSPMVYADVTIPANSSDAILSDTRYYCVPDAANPTGWQMSLTIDGEAKNFTFVNNRVWESGKNYIYIFSWQNKVLKLVDIITQETFFDCNDILAGGDFSITDMTE